MMNTALAQPFWPYRPMMGGAMANPSARWHPMMAQPAQSYRAPGLSSGGTIALGALFLFLLASRNQAKAPASVKVKNRNWQPPADKIDYKPSYVGSVKQSQRKVFFYGADGQKYSNYQKSLQDAMRQTGSLQEALNRLSQNGYEDQDVRDNERDTNTDKGFWGRLTCVQSAQKTDAFNKADNGNPHKPRFYLFIGGKDKTGQFKQMGNTLAQEYGVKGSNMIFTGGVDPASVEAGYQKLAQLTKDYPHAEIMTVVMPDHCDRIDKELYGKLDERVAEGGHTLSFWNGDPHKKVGVTTETQLKDIREHYMKGKNEIVMMDTCRAGAIVDDSIRPPA